MVNWVAGDLLVAHYLETVDNISPTPDEYVAKIGVYSMPDGAFKGAIDLLLPLGLYHTGLVTIQPDNSNVWGHRIGTTGNYAESWTYTAVDGVVNRNGSFAVSNEYGQDYDINNNRYVSDFNSEDGFHIRKIPVNGDPEQIFPYNITDPNINSGSIPNPNTLRVNSAGTRAYWNWQNIPDDSDSNFPGCNRMSLEHNQTIPYLDLQKVVSPIIEFNLADFVVGPVSEYGWFSGEIGQFPYVFVIDLLTDTVVNVFRTGSIICLAGTMAINCDESLLAIVDVDLLDDHVKVMEPLTGNILLDIDFQADMGPGLCNGLQFAKCPGGGVTAGVIAEAMMTG